MFGMFVGSAHIPTPLSPIPFSVSRAINSTWTSMSSVAGTVSSYYATASRLWTKSAPVNPKDTLSLLPLLKDLLQSCELPEIFVKSTGDVLVHPFTAAKEIEQEFEEPTIQPPLNAKLEGFVRQWADNYDGCAAIWQKYWPWSKESKSFEEQITKFKQDMQTLGEAYSKSESVSSTDDSILAMPNGGPPEPSLTPGAWSIKYALLLLSGFAVTTSGLSAIKYVAERAGLDVKDFWLWQWFFSLELKGWYYFADASLLNSLVLYYFVTRFSDEYLPSITDYFSRLGETYRWLWNKKLPNFFPVKIVAFSIVMPTVFLFKPLYDRYYGIDADNTADDLHRAPREKSIQDWLYSLRSHLVNGRGKLVFDDLFFGIKKTMYSGGKLTEFGLSVLATILATTLDLSAFANQGISSTWGRGLIATFAVFITPGVLYNNFATAQMSVEYLALAFAKKVLFLTPRFFISLVDSLRHSNIFLEVLNDELDERISDAQKYIQPWLAVKSESRANDDSAEIKLNDEIVCNAVSVLIEQVIPEINRRLAAEKRAEYKLLILFAKEQCTDMLKWVVNVYFKQRKPVSRLRQAIREAIIGTVWLLYDAGLVIKWLYSKIWSLVTLLVFAGAGAGVFIGLWQYIFGDIAAFSWQFYTVITLGVASSLPIYSNYVMCMTYAIDFFVEKIKDDIWPEVNHMVHDWKNVTWRHFFKFIVVDITVIAFFVLMWLYVARPSGSYRAQQIPPSYDYLFNEVPGFGDNLLNVFIAFQDACVEAAAAMSGDVSWIESSWFWLFSQLVPILPNSRNDLVDTLPELVTFLSELVGRWTGLGRMIVLPIVVAWITEKVQWLNEHVRPSVEAEFVRRWPDSGLGIASCLFSCCPPRVAIEDADQLYPRTEATFLI